MTAMTIWQVLAVLATLALSTTVPSVAALSVIPLSSSQCDIDSISLGSIPLGNYFRIVPEVSHLSPVDDLLFECFQPEWTKIEPFSQHSPALQETNFTIHVNGANSTVLLQFNDQPVPMVASSLDLGLFTASPSLNFSCDGRHELNITVIGSNTCCVRSYYIACTLQRCLTDDWYNRTIPNGNEFLRVCNATCDPALTHQGFFYAVAGIILGAAILLALPWSSWIALWDHTALPFEGTKREDVPASTQPSDIDSHQPSQPAPGSVQTAVYSARSHITTSADVAFHDIERGQGAHEEQKAATVTTTKPSAIAASASDSSSTGVHDENSAMLGPIPAASSSTPNDTPEAASLPIVMTDDNSVVFPFRCAGGGATAPMLETRALGILAVVVLMEFIDLIYMREIFADVDQFGKCNNDWCDANIIASLCIITLVIMALATLAMLLDQLQSYYDFASSRVPSSKVMKEILGLPNETINNARALSKIYNRQEMAVLAWIGIVLLLCLGTLTLRVAVNDLAGPNLSAALPKVAMLLVSSALATLRESSDKKVEEVGESVLASVFAAALSFVIAVADLIYLHLFWSPSYNDLNFTKDEFCYLNDPKLNQSNVYCQDTYSAWSINLDVTVMALAVADILLSLSIYSKISMLSDVDPDAPPAQPRYVKDDGTPISESVRSTVRRLLAPSIVFSALRVPLTVLRVALDAYGGKRTTSPQSAVDVAGAFVEVAGVLLSGAYFNIR